MATKQSDVERIRRKLLAAAEAMAEAAERSARTTHHGAPPASVALSYAEGAAALFGAAAPKVYRSPRKGGARG